MVGLPRYCVPYDDFEKKGVVPEGWDERGIPWVVEIPWLNTYFTNGFMYGLVSLIANPLHWVCAAATGVISLSMNTRTGHACQSESSC